MELSNKPQNTWTIATCSKFCTGRSKGFNPLKEEQKVYTLYSVPSHANGKPARLHSKEIGSNKQFVAPGDVLISKINPRLNRTWVVTEHDEPPIASTEWIVFRQNEEISSEYLALFLQQFSVRDFLSHNASGVGGSLTRIKPAIFEEVSISYPPLNEQKRIVVKIEELFSELDAGEQSLRDARQQLTLYRQSLLKQAFEGKLTEAWRANNPDKLEDPETLLARIQQERESRHQQQLQNWQLAVDEWEQKGKEGKKPTKPRKPKEQPPLAPEVLKQLPPLPSSWQWLAVKEANIEVSDGPFGSNLKTSDYVDSGVQVIRLENIGSGKFIKEKLSFISKEKYELLKRHTVLPNDIVFASFITESVRATIVPPSVSISVNKADCFKVREYGNTVDISYLNNCFAARYFFKHLEDLIHGVGRPRINTTQLGEAPIPICPLSEQQEIVRILDEQFTAIEQNEKEIDNALTQSQALRQSTLKQAFEGKLTQ